MSGSHGGAQAGGEPEYERDELDGRDASRPLDGIDELAAEPDGLDEFDDDLLAAPEPERPRMHDDIPIRGYNRGEPVPDLGRLSQDRWREVLLPLGPFTRQLAMSTVATVADATAAAALVGELSVVAQAPRLTAPAPPAMPRAAGAGAAAGGGPRHQVNFRLGPDEHAKLLEAARTFGMRPGTLARVLTVRGVERALYDARRGR